MLVVGAGLGGLAAGLALQTDGHKVTIIDSAPQFAEVSVPPSRSTALAETYHSYRLELVSGFLLILAASLSDGVLTWRE